METAFLADRSVLDQHDPGIGPFGIVEHRYPCLSDPRRRHQRAQ
ncbi:hypothetical protein [Nonomuraea sp. KM88]